eukprot:4058014-Alexandrium_andersonii.AAC.1
MHHEVRPSQHFLQECQREPWGVLKADDGLVAVAALKEPYEHGPGSWVCQAFLFSEAGKRLAVAACPCDVEGHGIRRVGQAPASLRYRTNMLRCGRQRSN